MLMRENVNDAFEAEYWKNVCFRTVHAVNVHTHCEQP